LLDSTHEKQGYSEILDYRLSEKFGLDWQQYDHLRIAEFIKIMQLTSEREEREHKKSNAKNTR